MTHDSPEALDIFSRESRAPGVSFAPGTTSGSSLTLNARPPIEPMHRLFTGLIEKERLGSPRVVLQDIEHEVRVLTVGSPPHPYIQMQSSEKDTSESDLEGLGVHLMDIAHGRSGDTGNTSNVAILARNPVDFEHLKRVLTANRVKAYLGHLVKGGVQRYEVPGLRALNFVMDQALDGGGPSSLRADPMGKGMAQMLLEMKVPAPR